MNSHHAETFIAQWHAIFEQNDPSLMLPLIHDDITFYSPAIYAPKHGKQIVFPTLNMVFEVFEDYRVTDTWIKDQEVMFEFETKVGKFTLQGIDRFRLDEDGKIIEMKVWIRPLSGLKHLARTVASLELDKHLAQKTVVEQMKTRAQMRAMTIFRSLRDGLK